MTHNDKSMESKRIHLDLLNYMLEIKMGRKTKISRVFGHSLGRHRKIRQNKYLGRPIYTIAKSKHLSKEKLRLKIKKTHRQSGVSKWAGTRYFYPPEIVYSTGRNY